MTKGREGACAGRVALVTGAAGKGMGRSIALTLAREGAQVVVNYRASADAAAEIVRHITEHGGEATAVQADVFLADDCRRLVGETVERFGRVDVCVIGPGAGWHTEPPHAVDADAALADLRQEAAPVYHLLPLLLPGMRERRWGRIVGIAMLGSGSPSYAYDVAKAARRSALLLAAARAAGGGVTVNIVSPAGVAEVPTFEAAVELCEHGRAWRKRKALTPQDVAEGVAHLCSDAGRFINGCELPYQ